MIKIFSLSVTCRNQELFQESKMYRKWRISKTITNQENKKDYFIRCFTTGNKLRIDRLIYSLIDRLLVLLFISFKYLSRNFVWFFSSPRVHLGFRVYMILKNSWKRVNTQSEECKTVQTECWKLVWRGGGTIFFIEWGNNRNWKMIWKPD